MAIPQYELVKKSGNYPPPGAVQLGWQYDASGKQWTAVAHTQWGDIPGKAREGTCWYSYGSKEYDTQNFSWLVSSKSEMALMMNDGSGPCTTALDIGRQNDGAGDLFAAIAVSDDLGFIPGKAKGNTCWYPYGGKEYVTSVFFWVCTSYKLESKKEKAPSDAVKMAWQAMHGDGHYSAVAHTSNGNIPGKAQGGICWYPFYGKEYVAESFSYVTAPPCTAVLLRNSSGPPAMALRTGHETTGGGDMFAAVAITKDWGTIPGKAHGNLCYYSYGGKEYSTSEFYWVTCFYDCLKMDPPENEAMTRKNQRTPPLGSYYVRRDPQTLDQLILQPSDINDARQLHIRNVVQVLITRWTDESIKLSTGGFTLATETKDGRTARLDDQGNFNEDGTRYTNIQIQTGQVTVAAAFIQTGVNFGHHFIRRALNMNMDTQMKIKLKRVYKTIHEEL